MKGAALVLLLAGSAPASDYALPPPPPGPHVDYAADQVEFDSDKSSLHLSGNVTVKESTITIKGQDFWIDTSSRTGRSDQPFILDDGLSAVYGESGEFDFINHTGRLFRSLTGVGNWRIRAREARLYNDRRVKYRVANFTSCDQVPPDYHFRASSVRVVPKKYALAFNSLFYLGKVPVFYTPVFYRSLDPNPRLKWRFQPGYDSRNGYYLKGWLTTEHSSTTYSKILDDYYSNKGYGFGAEIDHNAGLDSRGSLFGYRIHEDGTRNDRWGLFGGGYKTLGSGYSVHSRVQVQSDANFNDHYIRSDVFRLTQVLVNSAALTKDLPKATLRLIYSRTDVQKPTDPFRFVKDTESTPRVEVQGRSFRIWRLPWLNTLSGFADNNFNRSRLHLQKSVNGTWNATRSFLVARGVSYTPSFTYSETFYNRFDLANHEPPYTHQNLYSFIGRWSTSNNLRFKTPVGAIDSTHLYTKRLKPGGLTDDTGNADRGVEQHAVALSDLFMPAPRMWTRISTSYDYRTYRNQTLGFDDRIGPITTDVSWQSLKSLVFTLHNDYKLGPGKGENRSIIGDVQWEQEKGLSARGGFGYNLAAPATSYQSLEFSFTPSSPTWRISVGLRSFVIAPHGLPSAQRMMVFEKEITWSRRWHDFYTKIRTRIRPRGRWDFTALVEFKFGTSDPKQAQRRDWESEWFPGRAKEDADLRP
ncbi:MAG: LPS-assembly protein LptD [Elusimicrobia bacterium]|nr:LPS-assembly protein LptD [Elusimicrobiota bacterium]